MRDSFSGVESARGLVEEDDGRGLEERACDGDALALASPRARGRPRDGGVPAVRQAFDDLVDSAQASRFLDICAARVGVSDAHISF